MGTGGSPFAVNGNQKRSDWLPGRLLVLVVDPEREPAAQARPSTPLPASISESTFHCDRSTTATCLSRSRNISNFAVGAGQNFDRMFGDIHGPDHLRLAKSMTASWLALGSASSRSGRPGGRTLIPDCRQRYPGFDLVGGGIDHGQLRLRLVRGKDHLVVVRNGDALRYRGDGNDGDGLAAG